MRSEAAVIGHLIEEGEERAHWAASARLVGRVGFRTAAVRRVIAVAARVVARGW